MERYGDKACHFLEAFTAEGERLSERLVESSALDALEPWLSPPLFNVLDQWHHEHGTLAPAYWSRRYPDLIPLLDKYGYNAALAFEAASRFTTEPVKLLNEISQKYGADGLIELLADEGEQ